MTLPHKQPAPAVAPVETNGESITRLMTAFTRYAGWLGNNQHPIALRAHAQALGRAVDAGSDTWTWINLLDGDLKRLPSGEIPKMLRRTLLEISTALESRYREGETGPRS